MSDGKGGGRKYKKRDSKNGGGGNTGGESGENMEKETAWRLTGVAMYSVQCIPN
jgi:hypothetical protein